MAPTLEATHMDSNATGNVGLLGKQTKLSGFQLMLDQIEDVFERAEKSVDVDELWRILASYKSDPNDWSKFAYFERETYKRNLVAEHPKYNVMIITWAPGSRSSIHDHSGSHCFMKVSPF